jgi:hypothetical protein
VQLLHIVVHDRGVGKSAMLAAEPAGRRCNASSDHRQEIAQHAGVSRRGGGATYDNPGKPLY